MKQTPSELRGIHDLLKANLEANGKACPETCGFCANEEDLEEPVAEAKTYTEDQLAAAVKTAVDEAVATARTESAATISDLQRTQHQAAIDAAVAAAVEAANAEKAELQTALDLKTAEAAAEKAAREAAETAAAEKAAEEARAAEVAALKDSRIAAVREIAKFDGVEDLITASGERWAAMTDADFETVTDGLKAVIAKVPAAKGPIPRRATAMTASEDEPAGDGKRAPGTGPVLRDIRDGRYGVRSAV